jgi:hypothetical protein
MTELIDPLSALARATRELPILIGAGWVVRIPLLSREEGHEAITRAAWAGLAFTEAQQRALIRGVRAPDAGFFGVLTSALPFAQRRHALRAWSGMTTEAAVRDVREFLLATHARALAMPDGSRRWATFGAALHCLQDAYSPAHVDRADGRITRMKHWGPLDGWRRRRAGSRAEDEHGFPMDRRDSAWANGSLTEAASAAVAASRRYLELAMRPAKPGEDPTARRRAFDAFLDESVVGDPPRSWPE